MADEILTTDVVAELRDESWRGYMQHLRSWHELDALHDKAADEIERLRAREAHLLSVIRDYNPDDAMFDHEKDMTDVSFT